jgi:hypothetical protein
MLLPSARVSAGDGEAEYVFSISQSGTYAVAVQICFPFWNKNGINIAIDGSAVSFTENRLWWPYWRKTYWTALAKGKSLSAGIHTLTINSGVPGARFYGFRVCGSFSEQPSAGSNIYRLMDNRQRYG